MLINWDDFTGGPNGISNIPRPSLLRHPVRARRGRLRRRLRPHLLAEPPHHLALLHHPRPRADHRLRSRCGSAGCRSAAPGRRSARTRSPAARSASTPPRPSSPPSPCGAMFAGFAGSFFATRQGFISPESLQLRSNRSSILAIVVLGGLGSQIGVVIARHHVGSRHRSSSVFATTSTEHTAC